ncbi:MAG: hypothetical protein BM556_10345 [Bacteriovorax sp. MedPE-SWde]|nr:MAG: hypothetical protein BM556_10345 [Bacteriovorax sp. MedPE-SWde]
MRYLILLFIFQLSVSANLFPNKRTVQKNNLYRSAQLSAKQIKRAIKKWKIKTVINLRGESPNKDWWRKEVVAVRESGAKYHNIGMSAQRLPHRKDLIKLIELYETAERPILIHCAGGADRTGEASAMWKLDQMKTSKKKALKQLTILTRHIPFRFPAKRYFIKKIYQGSDWAKENYYPCEANYKYYDKSNCN